MRKSLVGFLFSNRNATLRLASWLQLISKDVIRETFATNATLRDEFGAFKKLETACKSEDVLSEWSVAEFGGQIGSPQHLKLITLHSAKGLEFDVVYMMGMDQGAIPWANLSANAKREPRRLFYVGFTRARNEVTLLYSGWVQTKYGRKSFGKASEFVLEIQSRLQESPD